MVRCLLIQHELHIPTPLVNHQLFLNKFHTPSSLTIFSCLLICKRYLEQTRAMASNSDISPQFPSLPPDTEKATSTIQPSDAITYPEGGTQAWLVVLGAWCGLTASIGVYNTTGVFSVIISSSVLPTTSASSLGWIFSLYAFVLWSVGVWVGPCFDVFGPRLLMLAGTCCTLLDMICLSFCTGK